MAILLNMFVYTEYILCTQPRRQTNLIHLGRHAMSKSNKSSSFDIRDEACTYALRSVAWKVETLNNERKDFDLTMSMYGLHNGHDFVSSPT
jgi:hypothetical protein